jgi:hypothetical protein
VIWSLVHSCPLLANYLGLAVTEVRTSVNIHQLKEWTTNLLNLLFIHRDLQLRETISAEQMIEPLRANLIRTESWQFSLANG